MYFLFEKTKKKMLGMAERLLPMPEVRVLNPVIGAPVFG